MLITRELLVKFAREYVAKKSSKDRHHSRVSHRFSPDGRPLNRYCTDIDLVVVHKERPPQERKCSASATKSRWMCGTITNRSIPTTAA